MNVWEVMVSIFWFMLLVAWFWLLITIISDVFRDDDLSGVAKAAWCIYVVLLPWLGVLTYLIVRGRSMNERARHEAARNEQAFRSYVRDVAVSEPSGVTGDLTKLADMRDRGLLTSEEYEQAKQRVLATTSGGTQSAASQHVAAAENQPDRAGSMTAST